jgi:hypothetical protein
MAHYQHCFYTGLKNMVHGHQVKLAKLSMCLTNQALSHECVQEWIYIDVFLTLALVWCEWSASRSGCFTFGERTLHTNWIGS